MRQDLLHTLLILLLPIACAKFGVVLSGEQSVPPRNQAPPQLQLQYQVSKFTRRESVPETPSEFATPTPTRNTQEADCGLQDDVEVSLLSSGTSDNSIYVMPLVISPKTCTKSLCLKEFINQNREWYDAQLLDYGAVLFRGFDLKSTADVEEVNKALESDLSNVYRGTSPRNPVDGATYVFSAAEVPNHYPIAQHLEMSFLPSPPKRLYFSALKAPANKGGETALTDFRKVYRDLPDWLREKLATKKLRYTRTHYTKGANPLFTNDISSLDSWYEVFKTRNQTEVEAIAARENLPVRWEGPNKDIFICEYVSEPFQLHPISREPVWFNHAQVFHWTSYPAELWYSFKRQGDVRLLLQSAKAWIANFVSYKILGNKMALTVTYGDGEPISMYEMGIIRETIHRHMVFNRWQQGDLLALDNFKISHGREPTYDKGRKVVVSWSTTMDKTNEPVFAASH